MTSYSFMLSWTIETELTLRELESRLDIWLLKYSVEECLPKWESQSISLEWYILDYENIIINKI